MTNHFRYMPPEINQYNPENLEQFSVPMKTFDDAGLLHSFNDEPSSVEFNNYGAKISKWHSHGHLRRKSGKPPMIVNTNNSYATFNEYELLHSYNDMPSNLTFGEGSWTLSWDENGMLHRNNDLPAELAIDIIESDDGMVEINHVVRKNYYLNGILHRPNGLPAETGVSNDKGTIRKIQSFYVKGVGHNINGPASILITKDEPVLTLNLILYGIAVNEEVFKKFKKLEAEINAPAWAVFLITLGQINENDLHAFCHNPEEWDYSVPVFWILKALGVTEKNFVENLQSLVVKRLVNSYNHQDGLNKTPLELLIQVANFETEQARSIPPAKRGVFDD